MRSSALSLLCALLALLLAGCTTGVLIADPNSGYEPDGDRYIRLRLETVRLDVVEGPAVPAVMPGALCAPVRAPATGQTRALQFRLPFMAWNGRAEPWSIRLGMFRLVRGAAARGGGDQLAAPDQDTAVALVPPGSGAHFDVLVHAAGLAPGDDPLQGEYRLTVTSETGAVLLVKNLSAGSFSQLAQTLRFACAMTLLLVAAAAL